jgi:hypothetical protein
MLVSNTPSVTTDCETNLWQIPLGLGVAVAVVLGFHVVGMRAGLDPLFPGRYAPVMLGLTILACAAGFAMLRPTSFVDALRSSWAICVLIAAATLLMLATASNLMGYIRLPVDLLSFSESPFVNEIIKFRLGGPIFTPREDNSSIVYTPGAPILTYVIAAALGHPDSIPFYRTVQFCYVMLAVMVTTITCHRLARQILTVDECRRLPLWWFVWAPILFLVAFDPQFNAYNHALHNDGLALLISACGFWLMVTHASSGRPVWLIPMAVLPAIGFMVKQNHMMWAGLFLVYLLVSGSATRRQIFGYCCGAVAAILATIGMCYALWGQPFVYWVFIALGSKSVSPARVILHASVAGIYIILGLLSGWMLVRANCSRKLASLWLCWLLLFAIEIYTSGAMFVVNHLGPGVVFATAWGLIMLVRLWPTYDASTSWWEHWTKQILAIVVVMLLLGAIGHLRDPRNLVTADFQRYVSDIENEFRDLPADQVLLDYGSWVYLRHGVVMKDRSVAVALHVGKNQPEINHAALVGTMARIQQKTYRRILAHQLDTEHTAYDFQNRGSGVKTAIFENYHVVRRIPAVTGIAHWWPTHLIQEVLVLEPN